MSLINSSDTAYGTQSHSGRDNVDLWPLTTKSACTWEEKLAFTYYAVSWGTCGPCTRTYWNCWYCPQHTPHSDVCLTTVWHKRCVMLKSKSYTYHISLRAVVFVSHSVIWGESFSSNAEMWLPEVLAPSSTVREKLHRALVIKCLYLSPWTQTSNRRQTEVPNFLKIMLLEALRGVSDRLSSFLSCRLVLHIIL